MYYTLCMGNIEYTKKGEYTYYHLFGIKSRNPWGVTIQIRQLSIKPKSEFRGVHVLPRSLFFVVDSKNKNDKQVNRVDLPAIWHNQQEEEIEP